MSQLIHFAGIDEADEPDEHRELVFQTTLHLRLTTSAILKQTPGTERSLLTRLCKACPT